MNNPWENIATPKRAIRALRVAAEHPLDFFWAKDHLGRYLFVYQYPSNSEVIIKAPPELEGLEAISPPPQKGNSRLILALSEKNNWELFLALCSDLLAATNTVKEPIKASSLILKRLKRWQDFLKKKRLGILSEEAIKGLIGELFFLKNYLMPKYGSSNAVNFWLGPKGTPQDFNINECAVEVKCKMGGTASNMKISSVEQLYSQLPKLYLYVVTLGKTTDDNIKAINLPEIINQISDKLEVESTTALAKFQDLLLEVGYYYSEHYLKYNYLVLNEKVFDVKDGFPRICPDNLPPGVVRLTYHIELSECKNFEKELKNWDI